MTPDQFLARCPSLWHVAPVGAWDHISRVGFRTAEQLIGDAKLEDDERAALLSQPRRDTVNLSIDGSDVVLRDQGQLFARAEGAPVVEDGLDVADWVRMLNKRVYFFADTIPMRKMLEKYVERDGAQDLLVLSPMRLLDSVRPQIQLASQNTGAIARRKGVQKDLEMFMSITRFPNRRPTEVTVLGGVEDLNVVIRVERHHADGTMERLKP